MKYVENLVADDVLEGIKQYCDNDGYGNSEIRALYDYLTSLKNFKRAVVEEMPVHEKQTLTTEVSFTNFTFIVLNLG